MSGLTDEDRLRAFEMGMMAAGADLNPYWRNYPKPAPGGEDEEVLARLWVEGYCRKLRDGID